MSRVISAESVTLVAKRHGFWGKIGDEIPVKASRNVVLGSLMDGVAQNFLTLGASGWRRLRDVRFQIARKFGPVSFPQVDVRPVRANIVI